MYRLRTGDVSQIRNYGRNYVILGKTRTNHGTWELLIVKNGVLKNNGTVREFGVDQRGRRKHAKVHIVKPNAIKRIHGHRVIDVDDIRTKIPRLATVMVRMNSKDGVPSSAPNIAEVVQNVNTLNTIRG